MKSLRHTLAALVITAAALLSGFFSGPAAAGAMSDYLENKLVDYVFRGQAYTAPTTVRRPRHRCRNDTACGTEVTGGSYARVAVTSSLANWAGTQSAGSTTASTGTSGTISNNAAITFPAPRPTGAR